jgi:hypothetical protein
MAADMLAGESGEETAALLPAAGPLVVLGRFFVLTATGYRLPAQLAVLRNTMRRAAVGAGPVRRCVWRPSAKPLLEEMFDMIRESA